MLSATSRFKSHPGVSAHCARATSIMLNRYFPETFSRCTVRMMMSSTSRVHRRVRNHVMKTRRLTLPVRWHLFRSTHTIRTCVSKRIRLHTHKHTHKLLHNRTHTHAQTHITQPHTLTHTHTLS